jgi:hypothetical protein
MIMRRHRKLNNNRYGTCLALGFNSMILVAVSTQAQLLSQYRNTVGDRIEAATILGGDFGVTGASYKGDNGTTIDLQKFGGAGDVGDPRQLGNLPLAWQPVVQGNMGYLTAKRDFNSGTLQGAEIKDHDFSIQFGGGARFWLGDNFSIAPTVMGMYGNSVNTLYPNGNGFAQTNQPAAKAAGLVDYSADTWTIRPALDFQYNYLWRRTIFTLSSDPTYFHTESFSSSNPNVSVNGDSDTWMNKLDVDVPLGVELFGHELRTGGFISRTDMFGDLKNALNTDHLYEVHGRITLDYLNQLWKVQWLGLGASYLWGTGFHGFSIGADVQFRF